MKQFSIGQPVRRVEDRRFITGHGNYVDDISRPRQAWAFMLRSPHAHARIRAIDSAAAAAANGVLAVLTGEGAAVERAMDGARHRIVVQLVNNRIVVNSMEPRGAIGEYDPGEDAYTLWSSTQGSHFIRNLLAESVFKLPENRIRVVTRDVGGGFGMKLFLYPEHILVLWAAKKLGRPFKWLP